jgi:hypothetical protein
MTDKPINPEVISDEIDTIEYWRDRAMKYEMQHNAAIQNGAFLQEQNEDLQLNLEIANERWVKSVNEQAATEVALRKLQKKGN